MLLSVAGSAQQVLPSQQRLITISRNNVPLETIFSAIESKTVYRFIYDPALLINARRVSLHVTKATIEEVTAIIFADQPFSYKFTNESVQLLPKSAGTVAPPATIAIKGRIITKTSEPIPSATIMALRSRQQTATGEDGTFQLENLLPGDSLIVSSVSYETGGIRLTGKPDLLITLELLAKELSEVVATGYQKQKVGEFTGSFSKVNNELLNYKVGTNVLDRLNGIASGVLFNANIQPGDPTNPSSISIRGRSTIFANPEPLIILDNFPYTGDVGNINPNDIESITILKDAAAASIWGALAANGVIVITSKTGKYNQDIKLSFNTNVTVGEKPNLYYEPIMSSNDYIDVEQFLFKNDHYLGREANPQHPALSPAVEIMIQERDGLISSPKATSLLNTLRQQDRRKDEEQYLYRHSINQQYALSASGGGKQNQYYFSAGYDKNLSSQVGNQYDRITLNANNTYAWWKRKLELTTGIIFSATQGRNTTISFGSRYPYNQLADANGQPMALYTTLRKSYIDTAGGGQLLDWNYRPLDELRLANDKTIVTDYRINAGLKYSIIPGLNANILYQYNKGFSEERNLHSRQSFFTRDLINQYTQINGSSITTPIPYGDILDKYNNTYQAHNVRVQADYTHRWNAQHAFNAFAGAEVRSFANQFTSTRMYGYDPDRLTSIPVNYTATFPQYSSPSSEARIPYQDKTRTTTDRYLSYFVNAAYTLHQRYILSASARKDESNIFGVKANQKGVPLWSAGLSWEISKEAFFHQSHWLPYLRLRLTHGYNGNVDRKVSAFTTAIIQNQNNWGATSGDIINPPNPALRWEQVRMSNIGIDFSSLHNTIGGSIEYYSRKAEDLIGNSPLDPTTGNPLFRGNTANMKGHGIDITLQTQNINKKDWKWMSTILFSHTVDEITEYKVQQNVIGVYLISDLLNPLKGKPVYAVYSLQWMGLDTLGDPQGWLGDKKSKDYGAIRNSSDFNNLLYNGPANPTFFGSVRNTINWKQLQLSFNITWKAGYYFRRTSINYNELFNSSASGHTDFSLRWQKPGDENNTYVPSMQYPNNILRDLFYQYSSILVEKGDHVRLQDIRLSYNCSQQMLQRLPIQDLQFYLYANNIGILWRANHQDIDPDNIGGYPAPRTIAAGIKIDFK
ncbi:SusC/RagA family TonB-linked outer membrane protein [Paraflavitalea soli]|uniref:SusC/RagA family TonB-linked outer membrane protein n=1 Tax=Paraflavitalea soli TaxID=2315862 RepID=UPI0013C3F216|nr:SusC/RagA family TonB-linked outer membrane protein [Paraflavitalea soli]